MRCSGRWIAVVPIVAGLQLTACQAGHSSATPHVAPAIVERIDGSDISRVTLTAKAAERLGMETAQVEKMGAARTVVPYGAVLYDAHGDTWVYTSPQPLVFVRHAIRIETIEGDRAILSEGPPAGTAVVTFGAAELLGTEFEVGH
jgi:hypothetical protein